MFGRRLNLGLVARRIRAALALGLVALTLAGLVPAATAQVEGSTYTDPQFGYSLTWDEDVWSVMEESDANLSLQSETAEVHLQSGAFYGGDAVACRDDLVERLPDEENIESVEPFAVNDEVVAAEEEGRAYAAFEVTIVGEDGEAPVDAIETIDCWTLVPGEAILAIIWITPVELYETAATEVSVLLDSLEIPTFPGLSNEIPGVSEGSYEDPAYGFTLAWDSEQWLPYRPSGFDLGLDSGASFILFDAFDGFEGNPQDCLDETVAEFEETRENANLEPLELDGVEAAGTDDAGWVYAIYSLESGGGTRQFVIFRCTTLVEGESVLLAMHLGSLDNAEQEWVLASEVFASLTRAGEVAAATPEATEEAAPEPDDEATPAVTESPRDGVDEVVPPATPERDAEATAETVLGEPQTYTDVNADWQLTYDAAVWTVQDPALYATSNLALSNGTTTVTFTTIPDYDGDAASCLDEVVTAEVTESDLVIDPVPLDVPESVGDVVLAGYSYQLASGATANVLLGCQTLANGDALVIRAYLPGDGAEAEIAAVIQLIEGVESPIP